MMANKLPKYLPSPVRRPHTQEFDYRELLVDKTFHALIDEEKQNGFFDGVTEGTPEFNSKLKTVALAFVRAANEERATLFRNRGIMYGREYEAYREAISCYNRALEISHRSPSRHLTLANRAAAFMKTQMYADALIDAQEAAKLAPHYAIAHSLAGYCQSQLGLVKEAIVNYKRALRLNPKDECSQELLKDAKRELISRGESAEDIEALEALSLTIEDHVEGGAFTTYVDVHGATHRRYLENDNRICDIQEMMRKVSMYDKSELENLMLSVEHRRPHGAEKARRAKKTLSQNTVSSSNLNQKLSAGKSNALASIAQLPKKLKHVLAKKSRRRLDPEPAQISGDRRDLASDAAEEIDEPSYQLPRATRDSDEWEHMPLGPSWRGHIAILNNTSLEGDCKMNLRDPVEALPHTRAASATGALDSGYPVIHGDNDNRFPFPNEEPKEHETCDPGLAPSNPIILPRNTPFEGRLGEGVTSPDTVEYNAYALRGLLPPSTPMLETQYRQCPVRPSRTSEATGQKKLSRRNSHLDPAGVPPAPDRTVFAPPQDHAIFVPPPKDKKAIPSYLSEPCLMPVCTPAVISPVSIRQPSLVPESQCWVAECVSDESQLVMTDPPLARGSQVDFLKVGSARTGALRVNKAERLGWTPFESSNEEESPERERSGAAVVPSVRMKEGLAVASSVSGVRKWLDESR